MKLLINEKLSVSETYDPSISDEESGSMYEQIAEVESLLESMSVDATVLNNESGYSISIYEQKIVLDEMDMNTLLSEVIFWYFSGYDIRYAHLGGKGCEMSIELYRKAK